MFVYVYIYIHIYCTPFRKRCPDARPKWNLWGRFLEPDQLHVGNLLWRSRGASMIPLFYWMVGLYTSSLNTHIILYIKQKKHTCLIDFDNTSADWLLIDLTFHGPVPGPKCQCNQQHQVLIRQVLTADLTSHGTPNIGSVVDDFETGGPALSNPPVTKNRCE